MTFEFLLTSKPPCWCLQRFKFFYFGNKSYSYTIIFYRLEKQIVTASTAAKTLLLGPQCVRDP